MAKKVSKAKAQMQGGKGNYKGGGKMASAKQSAAKYGKRPKGC